MNRKRQVFSSAAFGLLVIVLLLAGMHPASSAQQGQTPIPPTATDFFAAVGLTPAPPGQAYLGAPQYPLAVLADGTAIPSLTGVGGKAETSPVAIRTGPGLEFRRIGRLAQGAWINITGWNGWEAGRTCTPDFESDLDMWVEVLTFPAEQRGWIARCVLNIIGDVTALPLVNAAGDRILQR